MSNEHESLRAEYLEAGIYARHYSNLRFVILPVYFAVAGALGAVAAGITQPRSEHLDISRWAAAIAATVTALFCLFEVVCQRYIDYFRNRQAALEEPLSYQTMCKRPSYRHIVWVSTWIFYAFAFVLWTYVACRGV